MASGRWLVSTHSQPIAAGVNGAEVAKLFGVTPQHIYKMAASGSIPSFRIPGSVRFDPDEVAAWLKEKQAPAAASQRIGSPRVAAKFLV